LFYSTKDTKTTKDTKNTNSQSTKSVGESNSPKTVSDSKHVSDPKNKRSIVLDSQVYINISGGKVYANVDGIEGNSDISDGDLYIGGTAEVYISNGSGNTKGVMSLLNTDMNSVVDSGATVVVTGSNMSDISSGKAKQANIKTSVVAQKAGSKIILTDDNENVIISYTPLAGYSKVHISTPQLVDGDSYTLITGTKSQIVTASEDDS